MDGFYSTSDASSSHYPSRRYTYTAPSDLNAASSSHPFAYGVPAYEDKSIYPANTLLPSTSASASTAAYHSTPSEDLPQWPSSRPAPRPATAPLISESRVLRAKWEGSDLDTWVREVNGVKVVRRADGLVNGTKLLNCTNMTRGRRDGILKNEKQRTVIKVGSHALKGVWIPLDRAQDLASKYGLDDLWPLLEPDIQAYSAADSTFDSASQQSEASSSRPSSTGSEMLYRLQPSTALPVQTGQDFPVSTAAQKASAPPPLLSQRHHSYSGPSAQSGQLFSAASWSTVPQAHSLPPNQLGMSLPPIYSIPSTIATESSHMPSYTDFPQYSQPHYPLPACSSTPASYPSAPVSPLFQQERSYSTWYQPMQGQALPQPYDSSSQSTGQGGIGCSGGMNFDDYLNQEAWRSQQEGGRTQ